MIEKRFTDDGIEDVENQSFTDNLTEKTYWIDHGLDEIVDLLNTFNEENEKLKKIKKGQELEIVRLHHLADAMSGVLRELGIYDVYNQEQINKVKKELQ